ncbi:neurofilament heavy polypeptide isoform X2 [Osmerus mordax]
MVGYQWTPADLNFIKTMKEEKKVKELQEELVEKRKLLKNAIQARDLSYASSVEMQDNLNKTRISCLMKELSILQSQLEETEETTHTFKAEVNILKASEKPDAKGHVVKQEALQVTPVQRKVPERIKKKVDEQSRSKVLQVTQVKQKASEGPKPTGNEPNVNSQEVSQISTNHVKAPKGLRQTKNKAVEASSLGDKSKVDSLKGPKTVKYESGEIAHASTTQGGTSKIPKNNKKRGEQSTSGVVSQTVKNTRSKFKGPELTEDGGKGNSQVTLQGTRSTPKAAKVSKKKNLSEGSQASTKPKDQAQKAATGRRGKATAVTLKSSQKIASKVTTVQDVQSMSNAVHFEESTVHLQSQEIVQLSISPAKTSKVLRKTRKADGGSKPPEALQGSTKPKVQAPKAATGMKGAARLVPTEGVRRSKRIASKITTVK